MKDFSFELIALIAEHCPTHKDISSLALVNHHFYSAVTRLLYKHVMITGPRQYIAFKTNKNSELKKFVCKLDFSSYTTKGSRYSVEKAKTVVLANELACIIRECEYLKELFVGEELMHAFVSPRVIRSIFCHKNKLSTLDFTGFCDRSFTTVMTDIFKPNILTKLEEKKCKSINSTTEEMTTVMENWSIPPRLQNVSFYMCMALSQDHFFAPFFDKLAISGNRLTRLDLAYTQITSQLFTHMVPENYERLTHLNLQGCHSLTCCSPLISFIESCKELVELHINVNLNGVGGSRFCHECIYRILKSTSKLKSLKSLDMGGHVNFDDAMMRAIDMTGSFKELRHFSLTYCSNVSLDVLQNNFLIHLPKLHYLNLARTPLTTDINYLPRVLHELSPHIKVVEISPFTPKKYPTCIKDWNLTIQGRRTYYSRDNVDPKYVYPKKMLMLENQVLSPMNKYWCYSY
ncbi:unnamed protein product [Mucor hiemalis]